jgi:hypothetical protein
MRARKAGRLFSAISFWISADGSDLSEQSEIAPKLSSRLDWEGITPAARLAASKFLRERQASL